MQETANINQRNQTVSELVDILTGTTGHALLTLPEGKVIHPSFSLRDVCENNGRIIIAIDPFKLKEGEDGSWNERADFGPPFIHTLIGTPPQSSHFNYCDLKWSGVTRNEDGSESQIPINQVFSRHWRLRDN